MIFTRHSVCFFLKGVVDQSSAAQLGRPEGAAIGRGGRLRVRLRQATHVQRAGGRLGVVPRRPASYAPSAHSAARSRNGRSAVRHRASSRAR